MAKTRVFGTVERLVQTERGIFAPVENLPKLIIAVNRDYDFKRKKDWKYIVHTTGGYQGHQQFFLVWPHVLIARQF